MTSINGLAGIASGGPIPAARTAAATAPAVGAGGGAERDFSALLGDAIAEAATKLRSAEAVSMAGIKGAAAVQDVVEHVMAAEQALQSAIAVRDKIVSAYMEISRMSI